MSFEKSQLSNGLNIVTYSMNNLETVSINLIVGVGSRNELSNQKGICHFLEHMAFKGTNTRSSYEIATEFDAIGGQFNAYTSKENTVYFSKVLAEHTEKALNILSDIICNSKYDESDISKERDIIAQEIAMTADNPDELCYEKMMKVIFPNHPLGDPIIGSVESISKYDRDDFSNFIKNNYIAENIVLSIAGKVDHSKIHNICENLFSSISAHGKLNDSKAKFNHGFNIHKKEAEQSIITLGFESTNYTNLEKFYKTQILSLLLGGGISSRLFQNIREKHGLAYSVGSFNSSFSDIGIFSVYCATSHDKVQFAIDKIKDEIENICLNISTNELDRAKSQIKALTVMAEEKNSYKSEEIGKNYLLFKKYISSVDVVKKVLDMTHEDISNIAQEIFANKPVISIVTDNSNKLDQVSW